MTGITLSLDTALFTGGTTSSLTPLPYHCSINGRGYIIDSSFSPYRREAWRHKSIDMLRSQADTSNLPGQQSLNPEGLWRRTQETWHGGAGQSYLDRNTADGSISSVAYRFRSSKGINPWNKFQLTLLGDTAKRRASANTNLAVMSVGGYLYLTDGTSLLYTQDMSVGSPSFTTVTGTPGVAATSICSDGFNVYTAHGTSGVYKTTRGGATTASYATGTVSLVAYVKGRLMAAQGPNIYNIITNALPTALFTQANTDFTWVGFAPGPSNIYMAGYSGDKSLIYRTAVKTDGTALDVPQVAGELPDGEIVSSITGYLGFIVLGSSLGVRFCTVDSNGNLALGDLIPTSSSVQCFSTYNRYVWFGWTNYDGTSTGLGRLDLRTVNDNAPAYASDLMATAQGAVTSIATFQGVRMFAVSGVGFYAETSTKVASGTLDSGYITYGIVDQKLPVFLHLDYKSLIGSIAGSIALDDGAFTTVGTQSVQSTVTVEYPTSQTLYDHAEVRITLTRNNSSDTVGPQLARYTLRSNPAAPTGTNLIIPVRLHQEMLVLGNEESRTPSTELAFFDDLRTSRRVFTYQEASTSYTVTLETMDWIPDSFGYQNAEVNGVCVVTMKTLV